MPLMMGDWIRGTRGMRADVKGVYIGLLIHQYDSGYLPADLEELALIEPEVGKVWVKLKEKFFEFEPGKLQNKKLEEVRAFWNKQGNNGKKGGRPKKENPNHIPKTNPSDNPNHNHHNDLDLDTDLYLKNNKESLSKLEIFEALFNDQIYVEQLSMTHKGKSLNQAFEECYTHHSNAPNPPGSLGEWKQKLNTWLVNTKLNGTSKNGKQTTRDLATALQERIMRDAIKKQSGGSS